MVHLRRKGLHSPAAAFAGLRPFRDALIEMQNQCRPFGPDFLILEAVKRALDTAAHHFTGEPSFFAARPDQSKAGKAG
jgi:hypothetical protein